MKKIFLFIIYLFISKYSFLQYNYGWDNKNLNVVTFRNGDSLFFAKSNDEWKKASEDGIPAYCYFENNPINGFLYNWFAVSDERELAPVGWRIPSKDDYEKLINICEFNNKDLNQILNLKYSGYRSFDGADFYSKGEVSYFWSSTKANNGYLEANTFLYLFDDKQLLISKNRREDGCSVVCIRNYNEDIIGLPPREISSKTSVCKGDVLTLTAVGGELAENSSWVWYENDVKIGEGEEIRVTPLKTSIYSVRSESKRGKFSEFRYKKINVNDLPTTPESILISGNVYKDSNGKCFICEGENFTLKAVGELSENSSFQWIKNGVVLSEKDFLTTYISSDATFILQVKSEVCGVSKYISQDIKVLAKSTAPNKIYSSKLANNKNQLEIGYGGKLGYNANWKWYIEKKNGKLKYLNSGTSTIINPYKTNKYIIKAEGSICNNVDPEFIYSFYKEAKPVGGNRSWEKKYSYESTRIFHFGFELGLDAHNLTDSINVMDSVYNFRAMCYGLNIGTSFHPIINEFFTLGARSNFIIDFGKISNSSQFYDLLSSSSNFSEPTFTMAKSSVGGEMLIGFLRKGKLKLLIDYDLSKYTTFKSFGDSSFNSYRVVKKESTGIGFRFGSYSKTSKSGYHKNGVQLDLLYSLSNFNESLLFDFSQSMFNQSSNLRSGIKLRLWVHNAVKLEAGIIFELMPNSNKLDFRINNAIINYGLIWSLDRFY